MIGKNTCVAWNMELKLFEKLSSKVDERLIFYLGHFRYPTFSSLKTIPTVSVCTWNFRAKYVKAKKQAGLSRSTLGPYYKVSSNNSIVLHSPQELNKESLRLVYKIWVMRERGRKKFFLLSQNTMYMIQTYIIKYFILPSSVQIENFNWNLT